MPSRSAPMSLRVSLIRTISLVLLGTLVLGAVLTYWQAEVKVETEVSTAMVTAERTVRQAVQEMVHADDPRLELLRLVRVFDGNRHVRAALVEPEPADTRITSFGAPAEELPNWFYKLFAVPERLERIELPEGLKRFGAFELEADGRGEIAEVWDDAMLKLAILSVFCALVALLVYLSLGRALQPINDLVAAFDRVGTGDYRARVKESGPTELVTLASGFNGMTARLGQMEERNRQLHDQLQTVQEEERADLARDLHDEVSPFLFSVEVDASTIKKLAHEETEIAARTDSIREAVSHMKKQVRSILGRLRPAVQFDLGLANAIESMVASWQLRNPEVAFNLDIGATSGGAKLDSIIHGIVREGLSNALKHGKPSVVDVTVAETDDAQIHVSVRDDGKGLDAGATNSGFGLIAMRERVAALGGTMTVANRTGKSGVEILVKVPAREPRGGDENGAQELSHA